MINFQAPLNQLGYGIVGLNVVKELSERNVDFSLFRLGGNGDNKFHYIPDEYLEPISKGENRAKFLDYGCPSIKLWHQNDYTCMPGYGHRVGWPIFELDRFTEHEMYHLNSLDKILVCSQWAKDIVGKELPHIPCEVVPLGVDHNTFFPALSSIKNMTVFLNVGKWEVRKGHELIIEAFLKAFKQDDKVQLWMVCESPFNNSMENKYWYDLYTQHDLQDKVKLINRTDTQEQLSNLMREAHCGIFPSFAEGWNLDLLEMMSCGKEVICTDYSGHTEFCNRDNAHLIKRGQMVDAFDGKWFKNQGQWFYPDIDTIVEKMRKVHKGNKELNEAGIETAKEFSWSNTVDKMMEAL